MGGNDPKGNAEGKEGAAKKGKQNARGRAKSEGKGTFAGKSSPSMTRMESLEEPGCAYRGSCPFVHPKLPDGLLGRASSTRGGLPVFTIP